jgi:hypothetical protein
MSGTEILEILNSHERDSHITFDEGPHIYTIDGNSDFTSVTTVGGSHFNQFDSAKILANLSRKEGSKYHNMTDEEILAIWDKNRDDAATAGTLMHADIEHFYNHQFGKIKTSGSIEFGYFKQFNDDFVRRQNSEINTKSLEMRPYRTEWMIYDLEVRIAGSIDMTFIDKNGDIHIYDWKRCKKIEKCNRFNKSAKTSFLEHLPDTNYWHYALQLNIYRWILQKNYGVAVKSLYLVCLHPNYSNYQMIKLPILPAEIDDIINLRKQELSKL